MGRIISTSSTNTRHEHKYKTSENKHTMKFTGLIASTLMLLLAVMASTASARAIAFSEPPICCNAYNAKCEACRFGITVEEMCRVHEEDMALDSHLQPLQGCPKKPKKCCRANTLECQACNAGVSEEEFCRR